MAPPLNFATTTHDKTIYHTIYKGEHIFMLRQVDDFALAYTTKRALPNRYTPTHRGKPSTTHKEDKDPFAYLGLVEDYNVIDVLNACVLRTVIFDLYCFSITIISNTKLSKL
jgi:hypothetical protein